jgi:acyl-CoA synthetase (AMP-forming)/AMP-acid ligase II
VEDALEIVEKVRDIDVDEIACLIDFGVPAGQVIAHLPLLSVVHERSRDVRERAAGETLGDLFSAHAVTHFQCTPSMASLLVQDADTTAGLSRLKVMLVGGEALPLALGRQLRNILPGALVNVYGPTETTIWSTAQRLDAIADDVPIGRPLANTDVFVLDAAGALVPPGEEGELVIGGKGVARGYHDRSALTRERFVPHPFRPNERVYRTGDLARFGADGVLQFRGRIDQQVKVRGYRIEIGEIEARLGEHSAVRECVVVAREDTPGDKRLVGYLVPRGKAPAPVELRAYLLEWLPEYMVPSVFVFLPALPQTPNKKVNRKALPKPERERTSARPPSAAAAPQSSAEELVAGIWREVLSMDEVGANDNFFDLGGHSLLTIQVLGKLKAKVARPLSLVDLFRFPTIRSLAAYLDSEDAPPQSLGESAARGAERQRIRRAMAERRRRD